MKSARIHSHQRGGFTLLELLVAAAAASLVLICVYGLFAASVKKRDRAVELNRNTRLQARAVGILREDLNNAMISGGILASSLQGDATSTQGGSSFPGYLKFTTTTGKDTTDEQYGDVQQVEYYIVPDTTGTMPGSGTLVRVITRDLLNTQTGTPAVVHQQNILQGVSSFEVSFYDGATWQTTWTISGSNSASTSGSSSATTSGSAATTSGSNAATPALPEAIRVDIQMAASGSNGVYMATNKSGGVNAGNPLPPALEVLVPWNTAPYLSGTNFTVGSSTATTQ